MSMLYDKISFYAAVDSEDVMHLITATAKAPLW